MLVDRDRMPGAGRRGPAPLTAAEISTHGIDVVEPLTPETRERVHRATGVVLDAARTALRNGAGLPDSVVASLAEVAEALVADLLEIPEAASSGARSIPTSSRHMSTATSQITNVTTLRSTLESASMRCSARRLVSPVSSSAAGVRRRIAPIRSRTAPVCKRVSERFTARRATRLRTAAAIRIRTIFSGGPSSQSVMSVKVFSSSFGPTLATGTERS